MLFENYIKILKAFDSCYFLGKNYFDGNDGAQNSLVFQVGEKYFKNNSGSNSSKIIIWKSKGLSSQSLNLSGTVGTANDIKLSKPYSIKINRCKGNCNTINNPYAEICVPDQIKNTNVKVFNLLSRTNETRHIKWHKTCKCKCKLDASICNNKQRWKDDKCICECKELIDKGTCDKGFIWNPSNCECEYDKSCDIRENLDYKICRNRKK